MFLAEFLDDLRAGSGLVADGLAANGAFELIHQIAREAVLVNGKGLRQPDPGHFPVTGGGVLAGRVRRAFAVAARRTRRRREMGQRRYVRQSEAHKARQRQRTQFSDVSERVAADVAVFAGVRQRADAHAVQHDPDDPFELSHRKTPQLNDPTLA